jgi:hypothetical protein
MIREAETSMSTTEYIAKRKAWKKVLNLNSFVRCLQSMGLDRSYSTGCRLDGITVLAGTETLLLAPLV